MSNNRKLKAIHITPELLAELFKKGKHSYEIIENPIPYHGTVANAGYDLERDEFILIIRSDEFEEVPSGYSLTSFIPVVKRYV